MAKKTETEKKEGTGKLPIKAEVISVTDKGEHKEVLIWVDGDFKVGEVLEIL